MQTGSIVLTVLGCLHILLSFGVAYFVYGVVFGFHWFPFLNLLGLFIILGIGADDIFVYCDAWKQSFVLLPSSATLAVRATWAIHRAGAAMFITSLTTACAFAANGVTAVPAIRMFGLFVAILIVANYLLVITMFPAVVMMHHRLCRGCERRCCYRCCCRRRRHDGTDNQPSHTSGSRESAVVVHDAKAELRWIENWCGQQFHAVITSPKYGPLILLGLLGLALTLGVIGSGIEKSSSSLLMFDDSHCLSQYLIQAPKFANTPGSSTEAVKVYLVFGVSPEDSGDHNDPDSEGELVLDTSFDLAEPATQTYLLALLPVLRALPEMASTFVSDLERFDAWLQSNKTATTHADNLLPSLCDTALPLPTHTFNDCLARWFASDARQAACTSLRSGNCDEDGYCDCGSELRFQEGAVVAMVLMFRTNVVPVDEWDYDKLKPLWLTLENTLAAHNSRHPAAVGGFFTAWQFRIMDLQDNMIDAAVTAASLSLILAFCVILGSTLDLLITVYAVVSVCRIVASVMGCIVLMGWELGLLESMCIAILIGVSVDFVVHIAHAWTSANPTAVNVSTTTTTDAETSPPAPVMVADAGIDGAAVLDGKSDRRRRTQISLETMGVSVLSAGVTTCVAAAVLLFGEIRFFSQFGQVCSG